MVNRKPHSTTKPESSGNSSPTAAEKSKSIVESQSRSIAKFRKQDIFLYNGPIDDERFGSLFLSLQEQEREYDSALLILVTLGGDANSAYRIARFLHQAYRSFDLYVPSVCRSAGTLLALGAHSIIMSDVGELGPLDVQRYKADEIGERRSGLIIRSAMESLAEHAAELFDTIMINIKRDFGQIRFTTAAELAAKITVGALSGIYQHVDPIDLGEDYRDLNVAIRYGDRLSEKSTNVKTGSVEKLVHGYPSHDFVIDVDEARELFHRVEKPDGELVMLTVLLRGEAFHPEGRNGFVKRLSKPTAGDTTVASEENYAKARQQSSERPSVSALLGNGTAAAMKQTPFSGSSAKS